MTSPRLITCSCDRTNFEAFGAFYDPFVCQLTTLYRHGGDISSGRGGVGWHWGGEPPSGVGLDPPLSPRWVALPMGFPGSSALVGAGRSSAGPQGSSGAGGGEYIARRWSRPVMYLWGEGRGTTTLSAAGWDGQGARQGFHCSN